MARTDDTSVSYLAAQVLLGGHQVDINGESCPNAASPLQIAVERKDLELVKILKHAGANPELARLTVATKLQHLKRTSISSPAAASSSSAAPSPSNGCLRTPEQSIPARTSYVSPASSSEHPSPVEAKGKQSAPSSPFQQSSPSCHLVPEITALPGEDVKGKRSLWPPPTPQLRAGVPPLGDKRNSGRRERRSSNGSMYPGRIERRDSDAEAKSEGRLRDRRDSSEDMKRANSNFARMHESRSTDLLLAQV